MQLDDCFPPSVEIGQRLKAAPATTASDRATVAQAAGLAAYEQARLDGLCDEGAWECALEAVRRALANAGYDEGHTA